MVPGYFLMYGNSRMHFFVQTAHIFFSVYTTRAQLGHCFSLLQQYLHNIPHFRLKQFIKPSILHSALAAAMWSTHLIIWSIQLILRYHYWKTPTRHNVRVRIPARDTDHAFILFAGVFVFVVAFICLFVLLIILLFHSNSTLPLKHNVQIEWQDSGLSLPLSHYERDTTQ